MQVSVKLDRSNLNRAKPGPVHLMVSLTAPEVAEEERKPIDVVLALDVSPSMSDPATADLHGPSKFDLMKDAARQFIKELRPDDRLGIVAYSGAAHVIAPLTTLTDAERATLNQRIAQLVMGPGTDLVAGALRGLAVMSDCAPNEKRTRRVMLFTDGLPTVGVQKHEDVVRAIGAKLDGKTPITTVGFGAQIVANGIGDGGYDPELLTSIAKLAGGHFYHADAEGILQAFALELGALRSIAATDVQVEITPGKGIEIQSVFGEFTVTKKGGVFTVSVGNLHGGEKQYVLAELKVPTQDTVSMHEAPAGSVTVTGVETVIGEAFKEQQEARFRYVQSDEADQKPDPTVEAERLRYLAAKKLEQAFAMAQAGDHGQAAMAIEEMIPGLAALGTPEAAMLADSLSAVGHDLRDSGRFRAQAGSIRATTHAFATRRAAGSSYADRSYMTRAQHGTIHGMTPPEDKPAAKPDEEKKDE